MPDVPQPSTSLLINCALHAATGGAFFFILQYFVLTSSLSNSTLWAIAGAIGAAYLSWSQQTRNSGN